VQGGVILVQGVRREADFKDDTGGYEGVNPVTGSRIELVARVCRGEIRAANSLMLKALILDAFDNYEESWPEEMLWDRIRDAVVQPGATDSARDATRDPGAARAHAVWDATADALEVALTRTCAMLIAVAEEEVGPVAEHAISQRREVIEERATGRNPSPRPRGVAELRIPHRDPRAAQEVYRELSPRLEEGGGEGTSASGDEASRQDPGESGREAQTRAIWPDLAVYDIQPSLERVAVQNATRPAGYTSSWSGWHDIELQMRYDDIQKARNSLFGQLEEVAALEATRDEAVRKNAEAKAGMIALEKRGVARVNRVEETLTQEDAREYAREKARAERRRPHTAHPGTTTFTGAARTVAARPSSAHVTVPSQAADHPRLHLGGEAVFRPQGYTGGVGSVNFQSMTQHGRPRRPRSTAGATQSPYNAPKEDLGAFPRREKSVEKEKGAVELAKSASTVQRWRVQYTSETKRTRGKNVGRLYAGSLTNTPQRAAAGLGNKPSAPSKRPTTAGPEGREAGAQPERPTPAGPRGRPTTAGPGRSMLGTDPWSIPEQGPRHSLEAVIEGTTKRGAHTAGGARRPIALVPFYDDGSREYRGKERPALLTKPSSARKQADVLFLPNLGDYLHHRTEVDDVFGVGTSAGSPPPRAREEDHPGRQSPVEEIVERDIARLKLLRGSRPSSAVSSALSSSSSQRNGHEGRVPEPKFAPKGMRKLASHYPGSGGVTPQQAAYRFRHIDGAPRKSINIYK